MSDVTQTFKDNIKKYGRQLDAFVTVNNSVIDAEQINSIIPSFNVKLFKTVMRSIEIDSNIKIEKDSTLNLKVGIKFDSKKYEYINFMNYKVIKEPEKQEDTLSYKIYAYDKMVESMIPYDLTLGDKLTVREYLIKICERLGWNTNNIPDNFINSKKLIDPTLHVGINYSFRDVLDEIATITCSFLLFRGKEFYLTYSSETNEIIDEEYLSQEDVSIKELYMINSLVFSRAEESDNIYRKDDNNIKEKGLHEFKIVDNQLLSTNDRDDYIDEMFEYLKNFQFYLYDIKTKGIMFLNPGDRFTFKIHNNTYSTILLNDEINITQGLEERMYIDEIDETETEYKYADTTDKKINKAYILVDKQNKKITQLTSNFTKYEEKFAQIEQNFDGITQKVENMADTTRSAKGLTTIKLEKCIKGYLIKLRILGNNAVFKRLYPANDLYPSNALYPLGDSKIAVNGENGKVETYDLKIPNVLRANNETQDEYILENNFAKVIRRVNIDGTTKEQPEEEEIGEYIIYLERGENSITVLNYNANIEATYVQQNPYTDQFATKVEMDSSIRESAETIETNVNKKLKENYLTTEETNSAIKQSASSINLSVEKKLQNYSTTEEMRSEIGATENAINLIVSEKVGEDEIISKINQTAEEIQIDASKVSLFRENN